MLEGSSNKYQNWELVDPEKWVPDGYAIVRVDSRGAGRSPGFLDVWSPREAQDFYHCIEWAGVQPWSNGKVGINGISYYAMNQWDVGALKPPHLAALCIWEGSCDYYRELCRHGGILSDFFKSWFGRQVLRVQHGVGDRGHMSQVTGEPAAGPETLSEEELAKNRADCPGEVKRRKFDDDFYASRTAKFEDIEAPMLSAGNWGGVGLHTRGNFEGWLAAGSKQKWLEVHGDTHFTHFYSTYGEALQKRFFGHFLKGENTGWDKQPKVSLNVRHPGEKFVLRAENEWPLARTQWTKYYLQPDGLALGTDGAAGREEDELRDHRRWPDVPAAAADKALEITGPVAAKLFLSSETTRCRRVPGAAGVRSRRQGGHLHRLQRSAHAGRPRLAARLAAQARSERSKPYRPWHPHDEEWPLTPGEPVELDVEIWPTSIVVPPGYQLALTVLGKDYEVDGTDAALPNAPYPMKGVGPFLHIDPDDRPPAIFGGKNTLHFAAGQAALRAAAGHSASVSPKRVTAPVRGLGTASRQG